MNLTLMEVSMFELVFKLKKYLNDIKQVLTKKELDSHDSPLNTKKTITPLF